VEDAHRRIQEDQDKAAAKMKQIQEQMIERDLKKKGQNWSPPEGLMGLDLPTREGKQVGTNTDWPFPGHLAESKIPCKL